MKNFLVGIFNCYFCGDLVHNFESVKLFDNRKVLACFGCYKTVIDIIQRFREN